ncbi:hypothetical protein HZU83_03755 [Sphaerotilus montanus]|uniref:Uncharacterized protein n=1 Tax=Sphaerotilus montanus TaxID=522889 RepID=A0A7Y9R0P1_9BURK|nr:hypothetical protein [Sphaerotilus montanus]NYG34141.1 hypothetical protein [Sphaerotilus montanus]NZD55791.1 hypothetical protein [Sphaerotilus montanus]
MRQKLIVILGIFVLLCGSWISSAAMVTHDSLHTPINTEDGVSFEESVLDDLRPGSLSPEHLSSGAALQDHAPPFCLTPLRQVSIPVRHPQALAENPRPPPFLGTLRRPPKGLTAHA